jgi:hypothetical protein
MRFLNVTIPQGATVTAAYLTLRASGNESGTICRTRLSAENVDNANAFSTKADFDSRWANRTATVDWDNIPAWTKDTDYNSPSIVSQIQTVINRGGWASGNAIVIFWEDFEQRSSVAEAERAAYSYDGSITYAPKLHIEYTPAATEKTSSDTGSGVDAYVSLETGEAKIASDTGSGVEGTPLPGASLSGSEAGSGIEALVARLLVAVDSGTGIEVAQLVGLLNDLFAADWGEGLDLLVAKIEMPTKGGGMKLWT